MLPIAPLMIEHRLIEKMINVIAHEIKNIQETHNVNTIFIDTAIDFIKTYADQTHHGKEEEILFRELKKKEISKEHEKIMNELIKDHKFGRETTSKLVAAKENLINQAKKNFDEIIQLLTSLIEFYPKHIEKEDKGFFKEVMNYFTDDEKNNILIEGQVFDRKMIHRKYENVILTLEQQKSIKSKELLPNWLDYM